MTFTKDKANRTPLQDNVFKIVALANKDKEENGDLVINATIGSLYGEDGTLVALDTIYDSYRDLPNRTLAKYSSAIKGNADFLEASLDWVLQGHAKDLAKAAVATAGGTGGISAALSACATEDDLVLFPEIAWSPYMIMADYYHLQPKHYSLFEDNHFNLDGVKQLATSIMNQQHRLIMVINDPCQNPTGYSLSLEEWRELISFFNELSKDGPILLINDIAYIDYAKDQNHCRDYMDEFNSISENIAVVIASSCSKSLTAYGMRLGAAIILAKNQESVSEIENVMERFCRTVWSNSNNGMMTDFVSVTKHHREEYINEKKVYIDLLEKRSSLFMKEADECGLVYYPYKDGFFITLKMEDNTLRDQFHEALMKNHIYAIKVNLGIRVAVCSLNLETISGLAKRMKEVLDSL